MITASGLFDACFAYIRVHKRLPRFDFGSFADWSALASHSRSNFASQKAKWAGETVVCVGNGPSLNRIDLALLTGQKVIGTNRAYRVLEHCCPSDFELVVQDNYRLAEMAADLEAYSGRLNVGCGFLDRSNSPPAWLQSRRETLVFLPKLRYRLSGEYVAVASDLAERFSDSPTGGLYFGNSVIFSAIQLAYFYGARRIVCIGIDMDYSAGASFVGGVANLNPEFTYESHCKGMMREFAHYLECHNVDFINATVGGRVEEIKRLSLATALNV